MRKNEAMAELAAIAPAVRSMGAERLYLFGSTVRDDARKDSDVDVFLDLSPDGRFSLLDLVATRRLIEAALGRPVDVTTREGLHPLIRDQIEHEAERVF
jgi:predicted nucleotidyltransferase